MIYCIDTSALINLDREYSYEVFPSLWDDFITHLVEEGRLIATEEVKEDLKKRDDELFNWVMKHCDMMFIKTNTLVMERVRLILAQFKNFINPEKPDKNFSDPFVIALALEAQNILPYVDGETEIMVITYERFTGNLHGPKMPDICKYYGLKVGKLIDIFKVEGWKIGP
jgi:hypothetical protein